MRLVATEGRGSDIGVVAPYRCAVSMSLTRNLIKSHCNLFIVCA